MPDLAARLVEALGPDGVITAPELIAPYCVDWTGRFAGRSSLVVLPRTTAEVAATVAMCRQYGAALVPQGGNTGLVGGSVPLDGEVVIGLRRLSSVEAVDSGAGQLTAGAGVTLAGIQRAAAEVGWAYGVDLASRDTATVGGTVATNAGGLRVLRYGDTRAQVAGVEAVLGDGSVVSHLGGLARDNSGYHLPSLLCGSEGTLGLVTAVRLRLVPPARQRAVALVAFDALAPAATAGAQLRSWMRTLEAAELFLDDGLRLVGETYGLRPPFRSAHAAYVLLEAADGFGPVEELAAAVDALDGVADVVMATDSVSRARLWRYREAHSDAINTLGPPHKLDVAVPAGRLAEFLAEVRLAVGQLRPEAQTWVFGHAAEGNLHVNLTGLAPHDERADRAVLELAVALGGTISAEHGVGTAKRDSLGLVRSAAEIEAFRAVKRALDPDGILNPNVLLPR